MKKFVFIFITLLLSSCANSQNDSIVGLENIFITEQPPSFPGGDSKLFSFLKLAKQYPDNLKLKKIEGKVYIQFWVNKNGYIADLKILRSPDTNLSSEAIRIVKLMPKWNSGKNFKGDYVGVKMVLPINFKNNIDSIYFNPETPASFPEGNDSLLKFLTFTKRIPQSLYEKSGTERYYFLFVIEKDGSLSNLTLARKQNEKVLKHYINIFNEMPKWNPGKIDGEIVRSQRIIPITIHWK